LPGAERREINKMEEILNFLVKHILGFTLALFKWLVIVPVGIILWLVIAAGFVFVLSFIVKSIKNLFK